MDSGNLKTSILGQSNSCTVGIDHLRVALQTKNQGHIDTDTLGHHRGNGGQASERGGNLDHQVFSADLFPQLQSLINCALGVVSKFRGNLERDPTIDSFRADEFWAQHVTRALNIGDHNREHGIFE